MRQRRRGADQRDDVGIVLEIVAQHGADDLRLVAETRREKRPDRPVDQPRGQRLLFRRPALALEKAAGDLAGGEGLFLVVDGQREEILPRLGRLRGDRGAQHRRLAIGREHRAIGLPGDLAGLEHEAAAAPHQFLTVNLKHSRLILCKQRRGSAAEADPPRAARDRYARRRELADAMISTHWQFGADRQSAAARSAEVRGSAAPTSSTPQAEAPDQRLVAAGVRALEIVEQAAPLADHDQQAAPRVKVLFMRAEMVGQVADAFATGSRPAPRASRYRRL